MPPDDDRARRRNVVLIATGGTVATTTGPDGRTAPTVAGRALSDLVAPVDIHVTAREHALRPSWTLSPTELAEIAVAARDAARSPDVDGVVVSHGTTTLEYTAFLTDLVLDVETPVVLTGAMRRADDPSPDGPSNLRDALTVAASAEARGRGALVVFAGRVIAASRAWKARRSDDDAFLDLGGDLGRVRDGTVGIAWRDRPWRPFDGRLDPRVGLVKAVPGMDGRLVEAVTADGENRGLVIEGLPGAGGVPPAMIPAVAAAARRLPVVVASRAPFGRLPDIPTGGTGEPLRDLGLLSAGSLSAEQAWLLLMAVLGEADEAVEEAATKSIRRRYAEVAGADQPVTSATDR